MNNTCPQSSKGMKPDNLHSAAIRVESVYSRTYDTGFLHRTPPTAGTARSWVFYYNNRGYCVTKGGIAF